MPCLFSNCASGDQTPLQLFGWLIGGLSLFLGAIGYQNDIAWNAVVEGRSNFTLQDNITLGNGFLNLTAKQQQVLKRDSVAELCFLVGLATFLAISIGLYTVMFVRFDRIRRSTFFCMGASFHGPAALLLVILSYALLNSKATFSRQESEICSGKHNSSLSSAVPNVQIEFLVNAACVCCHSKQEVVHQGATYGYEELRTMGICQSGVLKQMAAITLLCYTLVLTVLACTQFRDLLVTGYSYTSGIVIPQTDYRKSMRTRGANNNPEWSQRTLIVMGKEHQQKRNTCDSENSMECCHIEINENGQPNHSRKEDGCNKDRNANEMTSNLNSNDINLNSETIRVASTSTTTSQAARDSYW